MYEQSADLYSLWLISGLSLVLAGAGLGLALLTHLRLQRQRAATARLMSRIGTRLEAVSAGAMGVGERLLDVEARFNDSRHRQEEIENRDPGQLPYRQAARLIGMGASVDDLVSACGLSRAEAELAALLGGSSDKSAQSARH